MNSHLERHLQAALGSDYNPSLKSYSILTPDKAAERLGRGGWTKEKEVVRHLANGTDEHLVILSKPNPQATPTVVTKVKDLIHGSRKPRS